MSQPDDPTPRDAAARLARLEEHLAHLERAADDLSDTVARQEREIEALTRRVELLLQREAQRQEDGGGAVVLGDERPPHY